MLSVGRATLTKDAQTKQKSDSSTLIVKGHMLPLTKRVWPIKKRAFRQHVLDKQRSYDATLKKIGSSSTTQRRHLYFDGRSTGKIRSHCCYSNRSATGVLHKRPNVKSTNRFSHTYFKVHTISVFKRELVRLVRPSKNHTLASMTLREYDY